MALEQQLSHIVDRAEMHKVIDELEDEQTAILVAQTRCEHGDETVRYYILGTIPFWKGVGLLETAKIEIQETTYHDGCCVEDDG